MRLFVLALLGIFAVGAPVLGQESGSVESRAAAAAAEHRAALAEWEAGWIAYLAALEADEPAPAPPAVERPPAPVAQAPPADPVEERLGIAWGYLDDGGCPDPAQTISGAYDREASRYDVHAAVRSAPSGGDCRRAAVAYSLAVERRYAIGGVEAVAKFAADKRSVAAPYAIVGADGQVLARPDGGPSDPVQLPAGSAETVAGYLGITRGFGAVRLTAAINVVPVDWAGPDDGLAAHLAASYDLGDSFDLDVSADVGADWYGAARASWRRSIAGRIGVELSGGYAWGLTAVDAGVPAEQTFAGLPVLLQGPARDSAFHAGVGISIGLD